MDIIIPLPWYKRQAVKLGLVIAGSFMAGVGGTIGVQKLLNRPGVKAATKNGATATQTPAQPQQPQPTV